MSLKNAYREKMEAQIEEERARLELLKARAKQAVADGKIMAYEELADADEKLAAAKGKLKELAAAGEGAFDEMKAGVERAGVESVGRLVEGVQKGVRQVWREEMIRAGAHAPAPSGNGRHLSAASSRRRRWSRRCR